MEDLKLTHEEVLAFFRRIMNHWKEEPQVHRYWYPIRYLMWHTPHPDTEHLTEDFGIFLEDALMEQVQENPPKGDDIEQVFSDWQTAPSLLRWPVGEWPGDFPLYQYASLYRHCDGVSGLPRPAHGGHRRAGGKRQENRPRRPAPEAGRIID